MSKDVLDSILGDFGPVNSTSGMDWANSKPITIWVPVEAKDRYERLQKISRKRFGKKAREALMTLIEMAEKKVS